MPATVAMPQVMTMNSSPRFSATRYGRTSRGASTMPTKTLAAALTPTAPPMPNARSSTQAAPRTATGSTFQ